MTALAAATPVSVARADVVPGAIEQGGQADAPSACVDSNAPSGIGDAGATVNQVCGDAIVVVAPSTGQLSTATGPTIAGSIVGAPVTVTAGSVAVSPL